jgi:hypothetical protein
MKVAGVADIRTLINDGANRWEPHWRYCGRAMQTYGLPASKWANPYRRRLFKLVHPGEVIGHYIDHLDGSPHLLSALPELDQKLLLCWCTTWAGTRPYVGYKCHCDVLADLVAGMSIEDVRIRLKAA